MEFAHDPIMIFGSLVWGAGSKTEFLKIFWTPPLFFNLVDTYKHQHMTILNQESIILSFGFSLKNNVFQNWNSFFQGSEHLVALG